MSLAIRVRSLVKRFEDLVAVDGIDLDVRVGECFGLLGPNGAGKTTTIEILEGLQRPTSGEVELLGLPWKAHAAELRARIGIQLQETELYDKLSAEETVRLFRSFYPRRIEVADALAQVDLTDKKDAWVQKLSGGQKQRLAIACALVSDPELFFLDEPTTGLDPTARRSLWEIIRAMRSRGRTIVLTTHYMEEADRLCDRVAIIDRGKLLALDTPAALKREAPGGTLIELTLDGDASAVATQVKTVDGVLRAEAQQQTLRVYSAQGGRVISAIIQAVEAADRHVRNITLNEPSLETLFVSLTGRKLD